MITKKIPLETRTALILGALHYIGTLPPPDCGMFHPEVIKVSKAARRLIEKLAKQNDGLKAYIRRDGELTGTCTFNALGEICEGCHCGRKPKL